MTPNGAIAVSVMMSALVLAAPGPRGIAVLIVLAAGFAIVEVGRASLTALRRAAVVVVPLAAFMALIWVGIVGRAPAEIAADLPGTRAAALAHVASICGRLFFIVTVMQLAFLRFADLTPLQYIRALALPPGGKRLLVLTLSLVATLRHAIDRAHVALIAAGTLTRRFSLRSVIHSWRLAQTVWLSAVTIALGRMRDKWPVENTLNLLDSAVEGGDPRLFAGDDRIWLPVTLGAAVVILIVDRLPVPS
jgi:hypothetical protein